jgi:hypothetical protein
VRTRQLAAGAFLGILLTAIPALAHASHWHRHLPRRIASVTLTPDGGGSLLSITFAGRHRPQVLRSSEPIAAVAVADIDNDGNPDIVASSGGPGLLFWRNAGRGRFVFTAPAAELSPPPVRVGHPRLTTAEDGLVAADDRYDAAMPRAPAIRTAGCVVRVSPSLVDVPDSAPAVRRSGRAPPNHF